MTPALTPSYSRASHDYSQEKRVPKVYAEGRICSDCKTVLSRFNPGPICWCCRGDFVELEDLVDLMSKAPEHP